MARKRIRVLIVDDNAIDRELLNSFLEEQPDFEVVGQAADAIEAREKVRLLRPDVLTLDVSMPGMSGLQFLANLMRLQPMPVVMCSSSTEAGADVTLEALATGAVDFVTKPVAGGPALTEFRDTVVAKVRAAAYAQVGRAAATDPPPRTAPPVQPVRARPAAGSWTRSFASRRSSIRSKRREAAPPDPRR